MAERPVFRATSAGPLLVEEVPVSFRWHPGLSATQKKRSVAELHEAASRIGIFPLLEVSSKSDLEVGRRLSAFSLMMRAGDGEASLESVFQASKVFEEGGPFKDIIGVEPWVAKKDRRLKSSGKLVGFEFDGHKFPLEPKTAFYDWLYIKILYKHRDWLQRIKDFSGFTDIEFNPERSVNCQARSLATYIALDIREELDSAMTSFESFAEIISKSLMSVQPPSSSIEPNENEISKEISIDLQRELCRAYVHFARRAEYKHQAFHEKRTASRMRLHALVNIEDEGLISALGRLRRLIRISKETGVIKRDAASALADLDQAIGEIRDMREHYDNYLFGKGNKQNSFIKKHLFKEGHILSANAKWSIQVGSEEVLGARLNVDDVAKALNSFRNELEESKFWTLPHTAIELANLALAPLVQQRRSRPE